MMKSREFTRFAWCVMTDEIHYNVLSSCISYNEHVIKKNSKLIEKSNCKSSCIFRMWTDGMIIITDMHNNTMTCNSLQSIIREYNIIRRRPKTNHHHHHYYKNNCALSVVKCVGSYSGLVIQRYRIIPQENKLTSGGKVTIQDTKCTTNVWRVRSVPS